MNRLTAFAKSGLKYLALLAAMFVGGVASNASAAPDYTPGVWKNLTPPGVVMTKDNHIFCQGVTVDPAHPSTIYLCVCGYDVSKAGLFKTIDGGSTWNKIGKLDEPLHVAIDPKDSNHLYCVDGVRGDTIGFWESKDGGNHWSTTPGFEAATQKPVGTRDLYSIAVDPTDFAHILVSFHSPWNGTTNCGVLESSDCGANWVVHNPPPGSAGGYGMAIFFLFNPETKQGDKNTWLFTAQAGGFFRTTDAGKTWTQCYKLQMTHGGNQIYRTSEGVLYAGGYQYPVRSTDNGASWEQVKNGLVYSWYMGICGDGNYLYTLSASEKQPAFISPEKDGQTWTAFEGGTQKFNAEPFEMRVDPANHIIYSANWGEGLWAVKVDPAKQAQPAPKAK